MKGAPWMGEEARRTKSDDSKENHEGRTMGLADAIENHILVVVAAAFASGAGLAWAVSSEVIVAPKQSLIDNLRQEVASLKSEPVPGAPAETSSPPAESRDRSLYLLIGTGSGGAWLSVEDIEGGNDRIHLELSQQLAE